VLDALLAVMNLQANLYGLGVSAAIKLNAINAKNVRKSLTFTKALRENLQFQR